MLTKTNVETNLERYCNQTQLGTRQWQSYGRNLKKWTNLKLIAKSKVDASFREARKAGEGTNTAGHVENEDMLIISADRCISDSAERVTEMFQIPLLLAEFQVLLICSKHQSGTVKFQYYA